MKIMWQQSYSATHRILSHGSKGRHHSRHNNHHLRQFTKIISSLNDDNTSNNDDQTIKKTLQRQQLKQHQKPKTNGNLLYPTLFIHKISQRQQQQQQQQQQHQPSSIRHYNTQSHQPSPPPPEDAQLTRLKSTTQTITNRTLHPLGSLDDKLTLSTLSTLLSLAPTNATTSLLTICQLSSTLLLRIFAESQLRKNDNILPSPQLIHDVLSLWSQTKSTKAGYQSKVILEGWLDTYGGDFELQPDSKGFDLVLECLAQSSASKRKRSDEEEEEEEEEDVDAALRTNALLAEEVLTLMTRIYSIGSMYVKPNAKSWRNVLKCWKAVAQQQQQQQAGGKSLKTTTTTTKRETIILCAEKMEVLLRKMTSNATPKEMSEGYYECLLSECYKAVIDTWLSLDDVGLEKATSWFSEMQKLPTMSGGGAGGEKTATTISTTETSKRISRIFVNLMEKNESNLSQVESLFRQVVDKHDVELGHYWALISSYCNHSSDNDNTIPDRLQRTLTSMERHLIEHDLQANGLNHLRLIDKITTSSSSPKSAIIAELLLNHMLHLHTLSRLIHPLPDPIRINNAFNQIMTLLSSSSTSTTPHIESLLSQMESLPSTFVQPNTTSYNILLQHLAQSKSSNVGRRARRIFQRLLNHPSPHTTPDLMSYTAVMQCYASSHMVDEADRLLEEMIEDSMYHADDDGREVVRPDAHIYAAVIMAHAKARNVLRAREIFDDMMIMAENNNYSEHNIRPTSYIYGTLLDAYGRVGRAGEAQALFDDMVRIYDDYWSSSSSPEGPVPPAPNVPCVTAVMNAWAKSYGGYDAARRCEELLRWMTERYDEGGIGSEELKPTVRCVAVVMDAWGRAYRPDRAEWWLKEVRRRYYERQAEKQQHQQRDRRGGRRRQRETTEEYDGETTMEWNDDDVDDNDMTPNVYCYTLVLNAYARRYNIGMAQNALRIFKLMQHDVPSNHQLQGVMNPYVYSIMMNACVNTAQIRPKEEDVKRHELILGREKRMALGIAWDVLMHGRKEETMRRRRRMDNNNNVSRTTTMSGVLNPVVYCGMIMACRVLAEDKKMAIEHLEKVWRYCCEDGFVNNEVLSHMDKTLELRFGEDVRERFWMKEVGRLDIFGLESDGGGGGVSARDVLPEEWCRNVKGVEN